MKLKWSQLREGLRWSGVLTDLRRDGGKNVCSVDHANKVAEGFERLGIEIEYDRRLNSSTRRKADRREEKK